MMHHVWVLGDDDITVTAQDDGSVNLDVNDSYYSCTMTPQQAFELAEEIIASVRHDS